MVIIFEGGTWHIELHIVTVPTANGIANRSTTTNLDRAGGFMFALATLTSFLNLSSANIGPVSIRSIVPGAFSYGQRFLSFRVDYRELVATPAENNVFMVLVGVKDS